MRPSPDDREQLFPASAQFVLPAKEWITTVEEWEVVASTQSDIKARERIVMFLLCAYGGLLVATVIILFLQGFQAWGFKLESGVLHWLGVATIGEVAGLLMITIKSLFRTQATKSSKKASKKKKVEPGEPANH